MYVRSGNHTVAFGDLRTLWDIRSNWDQLGLWTRSFSSFISRISPPNIPPSSDLLRSSSRRRVTDLLTVSRSTADVDWWSRASSAMIAAACLRLGLLIDFNWLIDSTVIHQAIRQWRPRPHVQRRWTKCRHRRSRVEVCMIGNYPEIQYDYSIPREHIEYLRRCLIAARRQTAQICLFQFEHREGQLEETQCAWSGSKLEQDAVPW